MAQRYGPPKIGVCSHSTDRTSMHNRSVHFDKAGFASDLLYTVDATKENPQAGQLGPIVRGLAESSRFVDK